MKILIIGTNGFLGKHVKNKAIELDYEVLEITGKQDIDITKYDNLKNFINDSKPEVIINCAAFVGGISYGFKYPAQMLNINALMALNLYNIIKETKVKKLINPISNCAYPGNLNLYKEEDFFKGPPDSSVYNYGIAKRLYVQLGESYFEEFRCSSTNIVLSNMYGPEDHFDEERSHALGAIVKKVVDAKKSNEKKVTLWGTGTPIREWLYVEDGATALIKAIKLNEGHQLFNVGVGKGISVKELANLIKTKAGWDGEFIYDESKPDGVLEKKVDGTKGKSYLNWMPKTDLPNGIQNTIDWYIKNNEK